MERYMKIFATSGDVQTAIDEGTLCKPYVAYVEDGQYIDWNSRDIDYAGIPFTLEVVSAGTIEITANPDERIWYSINKGVFVKLGFRESFSREFSVGETISFIGDNRGAESQIRTLDGTAYYKAYGNLYSLCAGENWKTLTQRAYNALQLSNKLVGDFENVIITQYCGLSSLFAYGTNNVSLTSFNPNYVDDKVSSLPMIQSSTLIEAYYPSVVTYVSSGLLLNSPNCNYIEWKTSTVPSSSYFVNNFGKQLASAGTFVKKDGVDWGTLIPSGWTVIEE